MFLNYSEYNNLQTYEQLDEKLIIVGKGKKYGQIMFIAGGAGSGKGFAITNFLEGEKFKVKDPDELKKAFLKVAKEKDKYPEIKDLDLKKPEDVFKLHAFVSNKGTAGKLLGNLLKDADISAKKGTLPNIIFDRTMKDMNDVDKILPLLDASGYDRKNIHLTWVLTDYKVAIKNNTTRDRVVPADILLQTHVGAAKTIYSILKGKTDSGIQGDINVILNNRENTIPFVDSEGEPIKGSRSKQVIVKDFTYLNMKKQGRRFNNEASIQKQLYSWVKNNAPEDALDNIKEPEL
tara:strand:- start:508 stop:1380 length:873 start_codon:yes stop_codon:yes gene_type:complete